MRFWSAVLLYGLLFGTPLYFLFSFVPIINRAHSHRASIQDITLYQLRDSNRLRFEDYDPRVPVEDQRALLLERLGGERKFGRDVWLALCAWGRQVAHDETGVEGCSDEEAVKAALDRLTAKDRKARDVEALLEHFQTGPPGASPSFRSDMLEQYSYPRCAMLLLHIFYPNDDVGYLAFGWQDMWGSWQSAEQSEAGSPFGLELFLLAGWALAFGLLIQRGARVLTIRGLGRVLGLRHDSVYQAYERGMFDPRRQLLAYGMVLPVSCLLAAFVLEPFYVLYFQSSTLLYAAVFWNALMGGILVEGLENIITIGVIKAGYDPRRIIWDNILVVAVSVVTLFYFQNSWSSIASALALGLFLNLSHKVHGSKLPAVQETGPCGCDFARGTAEHGVASDRATPAR